MSWCVSVQGAGPEHVRAAAALWRGGSSAAPGVRLHAGREHLARSAVEEGKCGGGG